MKEINFFETHEEQSQARKQVKLVIEALLFASNDPLPLKKIREISDTLHPFKPRVILELLAELRQEYRTQHRSFELEEIGNGYILRTREEYGKYVDLLYRNKRTEKLSHAATEVLAIIAYKQPITRAQIEAIRGVDSSGILYTLQERGLVEVVGKLEAPGRPSQYAITTEFLKCFGLRDVKDLPQREN